MRSGRAKGVRGASTDRPVACGLRASCVLLAECVCCTFRRGGGARTSTWCMLASELRARCDVSGLRFATVSGEPHQLLCARWLSKRPRARVHAAVSSMSRARLQSDLRSFAQTRMPGFGDGVCIARISSVRGFSYYSLQTVSRGFFDTRDLDAVILIEYRDLDFLHF